jgi:hypothetical protein
VCLIWVIFEQQDGFITRDYGVLDCKKTVIMSNFDKCLVLRKADGPVVCKDLDAAVYTLHQETSYCPCFTPDTLIKTDFGEVPVEMIALGTRVLTRDNGYQTVKWVGRRDLDETVLAKIPALIPIRIAQGALGPDLPERDTVVSPQHRMLLNNAQIRDWFSSDEVLIAAHLLTCFEGVRREVVENVSYIHFMFDQHEIVLADGEWSESYQPNDMRFGAMDERHRKELVAIFPELEEDTQAKYPAARPSIDAEQIARALQSEV